MATNSYNAIGLMSGTSLDGVDIAFCRFVLKGKKWSYELVTGETIRYATNWKQKLRTIENGSAVELVDLDRKYGHYLGKITAQFIQKHKLKIDFVASHGHTIFHQPDSGFTYQLGSGAAIAAETGQTVVCDFRSVDVANGGQGAPLVPIGDQLLFSEYDVCLNIGGIANISFEKNKKRLAFDVCAANMVLNELSMQLGKEYDDAGRQAAKGKLNKDLRKKLNALSFYKRKGAKSLGKEWVLKEFIPVIEGANIPIYDKLHTICEHIAQQLSVAISLKPGTRILKLFITGGGAYNKFLIERIAAHSKCEIIIPEKKVIEFKEALIFAFLGVLRLRNESNSLADVTGAAIDTCGGCIYYGD